MALIDELRTQVGWATWAELVPHFARGALIVAREDLDLLEAAVALTRDDTTSVEAWLADGRLRRVDDVEGRAWMTVPPRFQFIIVQPWVLAQVLPESSGTPEA
jgi:hypothetical protein